MQSPALSKSAALHAAVDVSMARITSDSQLAWLSVFTGTAKRQVGKS
jgi:hypothetical protein